MQAEAASERTQQERIQRWAFSISLLVTRTWASTAPRAREAGYRDYAEVERAFGKNNAAVVEEVDVDKLVAAVNEKLSTAIFQDTSGDGVALVDNVSIRTYAELLAALGDFGLDDFLKR